MFCVIQEIHTKKNNKNGYPKELKTDFTDSSLLGRYSWHYFSAERFERPVRKAYKISIHKSYREKGKVCKRQFPICTVNYYDLATDMFALYDWGGIRIEAAAGILQVDEDVIYELIEKKLQPIRDRIADEFRQTDEYQVHQEHERITTVYAAKKVEFNDKYGTSGNEYDQCYDVFGNLHTPDRLKEIEAAYYARCEYERKSRQKRSGYYENFYSNYTRGDSNYTGYAEDEADKGILKQFYRELSKKYHPDANPDKDTSGQMKVLNQLKHDWGV